VQCRLSEQDGETLIKFCHAGFGLIQEDHKKGVVTGYGKTREGVPYSAFF
jgi:hypothetical protein